MPRQICTSFLPAAALVSSLLPGTGFACAPVDINCYWTQAEEANRALDPTAFSAAVRGARAALALSPAPTAQEQAAVLRLEGIEAAMHREPGAALRAFQAARRLDPSAGLPADLYPPDHPVSRLYAQADPAIAPILAQAQAVDPLVTCATSIQPEKVPSRAPRPTPLLIGALASGLASGGLYAWSRQVAAGELAAGDSVGAWTSDVAALHARTANLRTASGGAALLSAGLLTAGLTVVW